ncbi:protein cornichon homolog 4 isoform X1 [Pteropus alecto]|uniref:protein cornichon homolog 4 isoform X1 n=1 Tax=Pteropus alecto TaxID=9402 RepID=UPI000D5339BD|nr:protein cornichon homolog 4 isoform X1 [Pteropus alecto]
MRLTSLLHAVLCSTFVPRVNEKIKTPRTKGRSENIRKCLGVLFCRLVQRALDDKDPFEQAQLYCFQLCEHVHARLRGVSRWGCHRCLLWVIPELIGHAIVTVLMLISLHWFIFLLNLPVATWNIYRFIMVPSGNMGVFDPTEIHNRGQLKSHMKEAMIKLGFHLLCFFMYLYSMILALIND